jgi:hypothetical protein
MFCPFGQRLIGTRRKHDPLMYILLPQPFSQIQRCRKMRKSITTGLLGSGDDDALPVTEFFSARSADKRTTQRCEASG